MNKKTYEELEAELRFMSEAYRVVVAQRDAAQKNEKILSERLKNLQATLSSFIRGD